MNAKIISALVAGGVLVALQGAAQDSVEVVRGDFDGDGKIDKVWIEATYDEEGYALTPSCSEAIIPISTVNCNGKVEWVSHCQISGTSTTLTETFWELHLMPCPHGAVSRHTASATASGKKLLRRLMYGMAMITTVTG